MSGTIDSCFIISRPAAVKYPSCQTSGRNVSETALQQAAGIRDCITGAGIPGMGPGFVISTATFCGKWPFLCKSPAIQAGKTDFLRRHGEIFRKQCLPRHFAHIRPPVAKIHTNIKQRGLSNRLRSCRTPHPDVSLSARYLLFIHAKPGNLTPPAAPRKRCSVPPGSLPRCGPGAGGPRLRRWTAPGRSCDRCSGPGPAGKSV